jgi:membrane protein
MTIAAVFLDIDGTLVDSNELHVAAWAEAFQDSGCMRATVAIRKQIGQGADMLIPALAPQLGDTARKSIAAAHDEIFQNRYLREVRAFPQATALIEALHSAGMQVVLASSAKATEVEHYVRLLGVQALLAATTCADDVAHSKPAGDLFASALNKVAPTAAAQSVAVGDTPYDAIAAGKVGIQTIGVRSGGFTEAELSAAGAVIVYASVADLLTHIDHSPLGTAASSVAALVARATTRRRS